MNQTDYFENYSYFFNKTLNKGNILINSYIKFCKENELSFDYFNNNLKKTLHSRISQILHSSENLYDDVINLYLEGLDIYDQNNTSNCLNIYLKDKVKVESEKYFKIIALIGQYDGVVKLYDKIDLRNNISKHIFKSFPKNKFKLEHYSNSNPLIEKNNNNTIETKKSLVISSNQNRKEKKLKSLKNFNEDEKFILFLILKDRGQQLNYQEAGIINTICDLYHEDLLNNSNTKSSTFLKKLSLGINYYKGNSQIEKLQDLIEKLETIEQLQDKKIIKILNKELVNARILNKKA